MLKQPIDLHYITNASITTRRNAEKTKYMLTFAKNEIRLNDRLV